MIKPINEINVTINIFNVKIPKFHLKVNIPLFHFDYIDYLLYIAVPVKLSTFSLNIKNSVIKE